MASHCARSSKIGLRPSAIAGLGQEADMSWHLQRSLFAERGAPDKRQAPRLEFKVRNKLPLVAACSVNIPVDGGDRSAVLFATTTNRRTERSYASDSVTFFSGILGRFYEQHA
jgi:hypothetical protein